MPSKIDKDAEPSVLATNIKRLLLDRRMSQGDLADDAGLTRTSISAIMHNGDVRLSNLMKIAAALKTDVPSLLTPQPHEGETPRNHRVELKEALAVLMSELLNK